MKTESRKKNVLFINTKRPLFKYLRGPEEGGSTRRGTYCLLCDWCPRIKARLKLKLTFYLFVYYIDSFI